MKKKFIIGADISKSTIDLHCFGKPEWLTINNNIKGFKELLKWIKKQLSRQSEEVIIVMEHTGIYTYNFENFLHDNQIDYVKRPALDIKRSSGIKRGKTDKADAAMISKYGWQRKEELQPMKPLSQVQLELQQLMSYRDKLVADKASYQSRIKELKEQMQQKLNKRIIESTQNIMQLLKDEIKQTEAAIKELIKNDEAINNNYELVKSVKGIGFATTVHMLIKTENFTRFDARKFACYCGVPPFKNESGSSIRGRTKTSHLANRKIKSLLTMAAISAINHDRQLKEKYEQKVKEGKAKMVALNIIRFKLIERIFSVIKRQSPYILSVAA
jgi:transposase